MLSSLLAKVVLIGTMVPGVPWWTPPPPVAHVTASWETFHIWNTAAHPEPANVSGVLLDGRGYFTRGPGNGLTGHFGSCTFRITLRPPPGTGPVGRYTISAGKGSCNGLNGIGGWQAGHGGTRISTSGIVFVPRPALPVSSGGD